MKRYSLMQIFSAERVSLRIEKQAIVVLLIILITIPISISFIASGCTFKQGSDRQGVVTPSKSEKLFVKIRNEVAVEDKGQSLAEIRPALDSTGYAWQGHEDFLIFCPIGMSVESVCPAPSQIVYNTPGIRTSYVPATKMLLQVSVDSTVTPGDREIIIMLRTKILEKFLKEGVDKDQLFLVAGKGYVRVKKKKSILDFPNISTCKSITAIVEQ